MLCLSILSCVLDYFGFGVQRLGSGTELTVWIGISLTVEGGMYWSIALQTLLFRAAIKFSSTAECLFSIREFTFRLCDVEGRRLQRMAGPVISGMSSRNIVDVALVKVNFIL